MSCNINVQLLGSQRVGFHPSDMALFGGKQIIVQPQFELKMFLSAAIFHEYVFCSAIITSVIQQVVIGCPQPSAVTLWQINLALEHHPFLDGFPGFPYRTW